MLEFACYLVLIFVVYNIIYIRKATFGYGLFIKLNMWQKIKELIYKIKYNQLIAINTQIKKTN